MLYNLHFFSSKFRLFHNATLFVFCITHILNTECAKIWKKKSFAKRLIFSHHWLFLCRSLIGNIKGKCKLVDRDLDGRTRTNWFQRAWIMQTGEVCFRLWPRDLFVGMSQRTVKVPQNLLTSWADSNYKNLLLHGICSSSVISYPYHNTSQISVTIFSFHLQSKFSSVLTRPPLVNSNLLCFMSSSYSPLLNEVCISFLR